MNEELKALALRAVACPGWRWAPGMLVAIRGDGDAHAVVLKVFDGGGLLMADVSGPDGGWYRMEAGPVRDRVRPVLTDPGTCGHLLAMVREAWDAPEFYPALEVAGFRVFAGEGQWYGTEVEALVAALEAAPKREGAS